MTAIHLRPADKAWLTLWAWVFVFNCRSAILRHRGDERCELLSEACDRYLAGHRWLTEAWLLLFYLHLSNRVPDRLDPVCWLDKAVHQLLRSANLIGQR